MRRGTSVDGSGNGSRDNLVDGPAPTELNTQLWL
jgi:hypothetical protein